MKITGRRIREFQDRIFSWWERNARDLPWRRTRDPYRILVSEVMLQQTQVSRVLPKYEEFLHTFPTVGSLASASPAHILRLWKGLGYNRRALYLKRAAESVVTDYDGTFPQDEALLVKLPGLGRYTARALMVFAFEKDVAMVDTNIRQIITHFFYNDQPQKDNVIQQTADALLPHGRSWDWHQALMDYGALALEKPKKIIRPKKPAVPFRQSHRFYRGKVMDLLREGTISEGALQNLFLQDYQVSLEFTSTILDGLIKDRLVVRTGQTLHLPEK